MGNLDKFIFITLIQSPVEKEIHIVELCSGKYIYSWNLKLLPICISCLQLRGRAAVTEERLKSLSYLEPWIFEYEFRDIFPKMYGIPDRHLRNDA